VKSGCVLRGRSPEAGQNARGDRADAIVFVASDKAAFITGQMIRVNDGKIAS
jgi:NAD(P)-dependent dehydrogenase (short-subunit alcohol dehydrogenase family)